MALRLVSSNRLELRAEGYMDAEKKRIQRERRRREGYKPVELWLPANLIDKIDSMKGSVHRTDPDIR